MEAQGLRLLAQDTLNGFAALGEGMSMQIDRLGRHILWLAHESAPLNFTAVDVSDPRQPRVIAQRHLAHNDMRSNSLETVGDMMAVAYQVTRPGDRPAGIELFDISRPEEPRPVSFIDCSGASSRGTHQLWFVDGRYIHCASGAPDFTPRDPRDDQFYRVFDVSDPVRPKLAGEWWLPGVRAGDDAPPPERPEAFDFGFRAHNTNVYRERPDRAYVGYLDGGFVVLDISDMARPKPVSSWSKHPPLNGFTHTVLPLFDRNLWIVTDECVCDASEDWPKLAWVFDAADEAAPRPLASLPIPERERYAVPHGRYGAHNLHENRPGASFRSSQLIFGTYFSGGLRIHDIADPLKPKEVGWFVPDAPAGSAAGAAQINDVFVDDRGVVFACDRFTGGLYCLEMSD